jgi:hypothetical protein
MSSTKIFAPLSNVAPPSATKEPRRDSFQDEQEAANADKTVPASAQDTKNTKDDKNAGQELAAGTIKDMNKNEPDIVDGKWLRLN